MNSKFRCLLTVNAEDDPQVPSRILGIVTQRGQTPEWFSFRRVSNDETRVVVELSNHDDHASDMLAKKIRSIPTVLDVARSWLRQNHEVTP